MVIKLGNIYGFTGGNFAGNVYSIKGIAPALKTMQDGNRQPLIVVKSKKQIPIDGTINKPSQRQIGTMVLEVAYEKDNPIKSDA